MAAKCSKLYHLKDKDVDLFHYFKVTQMRVKNEGLTNKSDRKGIWEIRRKG
jgi:hypothetical protein